MAVGPMNVAAFYAPQQQQSNPMLVGAFNDLCANSLNPQLIRKYQLNQMELNAIIDFENGSMANILQEFQLNYFNPQSSQYDPRVLLNLINQYVENFIQTRVRGRAMNSQMNMGGNMGGMPALTNVSPFAATGSSMEYYDIGSAPKVNQKPPSPGEYVPPQPMYTNTPVTPPKKETPVIQPQEEPVQGEISCRIDELITVPQTEDEKQWMDTINSSSAQTCKEMFHFISERTEDIFHYNHVKVHVPYSNAANAFMDMATAYPILFKGKYATLMEFYVYCPYGIHFSVGKPMFDTVKDSLTKQPTAVQSGILKQLISDKSVRTFIESDMITTFNDLIGCYLSKAQSNGAVDACFISELDDIGSLLEKKEDILDNYIKFDNYDPYLLECIKAMNDLHFHTKDAARFPYVRCEDDEMDLAATLEFSGIRVGNYTGRNINLIKEEDENIIKSVVEQLRKRTIGLRKYTVMFTNLNLPEIKAISNSKDGRHAIRKNKAPLHFMIQHALDKNGVIPLQLDLSASEINTNVRISVGSSLNDWMAFKISGV